MRQRVPPSRTVHVDAVASCLLSLRGSEARVDRHGMTAAAISDAIRGGMGLAGRTVDLDALLAFLGGSAGAAALGTDSVPRLLLTAWPTIVSRVRALPAVPADPETGP
jgi:hypothetical protein